MQNNHPKKDNLFSFVDRTINPTSAGLDLTKVENQILKENYQQASDNNLKNQKPIIIKKRGK